MKKDYHMHPTVIQDTGRLEAFVSCAESLGIQEICITDHMPLRGNSAGDRIPAGKVSDYCATVRKMAKQYGDRISIKLGIEVDYHPSVEDEIKAVLTPGQFDYVLGSSHLHAISGLELFTGRVSRNEYAKAMFENTLAAIRTGWFNTIPHLDMHRWIFANPGRFPLQDDGYDEAHHWEQIDRVLMEIRDRGMRLEINPHLAVKDLDVQKVYPSLPILERALELGVKFCYGSDAHKSEEVGTMLDQLRLHPVYGQAIAQWEAE